MGQTQTEIRGNNLFELHEYLNVELTDIIQYRKTYSTVVMVFDIQASKICQLRCVSYGMDSLRTKFSPTLHVAQIELIVFSKAAHDIKKK